MLDVGGIGSKSRLKYFVHFRESSSTAPQPVQKVAITHKDVYERPLQLKCHFKRLLFLSPDAEQKFTSALCTGDTAHHTGGDTATRELMLVLKNWCKFIPGDRSINRDTNLSISNTEKSPNSGLSHGVSA